MANVRTPAGTRVFMQSAVAAAQELAGITKANPAVATYLGADPANGSYLALTDMVGMTEFEDALVKAAAVDSGGNTVQFEDQNSLGYGTFVSGNMSVVTLGTEIRVATGLAFSGGEQQFADYNLLWDSIGRKIPTVASGVQIDMPVIWDPADPGMMALMDAGRSKMAFKVLLPDGLEILFYGYVGAPGLPQASDINTIMTSSVSIVLATRPRYVLP